MEGELAVPVSSSSVAETPTSCCSDDVPTGAAKSSSSAAGVSAEVFEIQRHQILRELQSTVDRYNDCFRSLRIALDDVELLRQENLSLRAENFELSLLLEAQEEEVMAASPDGHGVLGARSAIGGTGAGKENVPPAEGIGGGKGKTGTRGLVPKSISIRSKGFLAAKDSAGGGGGASPEDVGGSSESFSRPYRPLHLAPVQIGEDTEGTGIAVEVYNQGMAKTELCNKWEELGWCPYGDLCQFAHGVDELRPVIRHPRYKTQLCRMINVPGGCPYGHRCHFRHALLPRKEC